MSSSEQLKFADSANLRVSVYNLNYNYKTRMALLMPNQCILFFAASILGLILLTFT